MKLSNIIPLGECVYELEKGNGGRRPEKDDTVELKIGAVETAFISQAFGEDADVFLPSTLEEKELETIFVAHNGSYGQQEHETLPDAVFLVIPTMTVGQKVLVLQKEPNGKEYREGKI
ncbi:MAG: hypothetical protein M1834_009000 [Cirrosporium novae-zelandiae]|nr:MAG: hypothetical protein M1834_009000 [Cirrosporium novae-zelandiae]